MSHDKNGIIGSLSVRFDRKFYTFLSAFWRIEYILVINVIKEYGGKCYSILLLSDFWSFLLLYLPKSRKTHYCMYWTALLLIMLMTGAQECRNMLPPHLQPVWTTLSTPTEEGFLKIFTFIFRPDLDPHHFISFLRINII